MSVLGAGEFGDGRYWFQSRPSAQGNDTLITFGLTDAAIEDLGEIEGVNLPDEGEALRVGDVCFTVEGTQGSIEFLLPFAARVDGVNRRLVKNPEELSEDPMEEGWLVRIYGQDKKAAQEFVQEFIEDHA